MKRIVVNFGKGVERVLNEKCWENQGRLGGEDMYEDIGQRESKFCLKFKDQAIANAFSEYLSMQIHFPSASHANSWR